MQKALLWTCTLGMLFLSGFWISYASTTHTKNLIPEVKFFTSSNQEKIEVDSSSIERNEEQPSLESPGVAESEIDAPETKKRSSVITYNSKAYAASNAYQKKRREAKARGVQFQQKMKEMEAEKQRQERQYYLSVVLPQQQQAAQQRFNNFTKIREQMQTQEMINLQRESNYLQRNQNSLQGTQNNLLQQQIMERQFDRYRPRP
ncbi:hypothetical protein [Gimesia maris]|uniref:Uncharacterized protein n=2 Tax=Gimesia maris TaxID=122 RepID=A0ABX5YIT8_9PLAN|nr:hypothetical protein [Gimesia maris]QEG15544.1 hypothetical protein GmarT_13850 [Gimesia maris]QGQ31158.1 hypothetical protein F1729_22370 [Gimesia maris]